jgi:hypothetical protein
MNEKLIEQVKILESKKYYQPRREFWDVGRVIELAKELNDSGRYPTDAELKFVRGYNNRALNYQNAINKELGISTYLLTVPISTLRDMLIAIKIIKEKNE